MLGLSCFFPQRNGAGSLQTAAYGRESLTYSPRFRELPFTGQAAVDSASGQALANNFKGCCTRVKYWKNASNVEGDDPIFCRNPSIRLIRILGVVQAPVTVRVTLRGSAALWLLHELHLELFDFAVQGRRADGGDRGQRAGDAEHGVRVRHAGVDGVAQISHGLDRDCAERAATPGRRSAGLGPACSLLKWYRGRSWACST